MMNMPVQIIERKVKVDGSRHEYSCDVVLMTADLLIIAYVMRLGGTLPGVHLPVAPGSVSYGYFWKDRPYSLYRMKRPDGSIIAHRFDAVGDVQWTPELLEYRDAQLAGIAQPLVGQGVQAHRLHWHAERSLHEFMQSRQA